jgi:methionine biosynthesis protein MetW
LIEDEPILDLGGGDGFFSNMLKEKGFRKLKLLDISSIAVEKARQKGLDAEVYDITKPLPFSDNTFGTVVMLDVLEHLHDPLSVLREAGRVSKYVVIVVPNFHYWKDRIKMLMGKVPFECKPKRQHVHWFNYPILIKMIRQAGLRLEILIFQGFVRFGPIGGWLAKLLPNLFAASFAVRLKKMIA